MRTFLLALAALSLTATPTLADWQVSSEFKLHLPESTFDKIIQDFWQSLQGTQKVAVGNVPVDLGDTKLSINGINVAVNYSFPIPQRVDANHREWQLKSDKVSAAVTVDQLVIVQHRVIVLPGDIHVGTDVTVTCGNISLSLPESAGAAVTATVRAEVAQNQVQLTMPTYNGNWPSNAWQLNAINCPDLAGVGDVVKSQILNYLSSFQNVNASIGAALTTQFQKWSQQASVLLLSQEELPTGVDYLRAFYEPKTAAENNGNGLILGGTLKFVYPFVAKGQHFEQAFPLPTSAQIVPQTTPQLIVPFAAIRAMMMGEYFAGKMEYTLRSTELAAFQSLMNNFFAKLFGWPDLLHFSSSDVFLFQALPMGPPSFDNEANNGANAISGDLNQPLSLRMFAPENGKYTPYVEFRTLLNGPANLTLGSNGKIKFTMQATEQPVSYAFAAGYVNEHNPNTYIAASTIAKAARDALNTDGVQITIPTFKVGSNLTLVPADWTLQADSVLRLDFNANSSITTTAVSRSAVTTKTVTAKATTTSTTVKTTNGKQLTVTSVKAK